MASRQRTVRTTTYERAEARYTPRGCGTGYPYTVHEGKPVGRGGAEDNVSAPSS